MGLILFNLPSSILCIEHVYVLKPDIETICVCLGGKNMRQDKKKIACDSMSMEAQIWFLWDKKSITNTSIFVYVDFFPVWLEIIF